MKYQVHVPICGLIALAGRVLLVDGSLPLSSYSFMTTLKQEFVCSEIPNMQFQSLEILTAIVKGLGRYIIYCQRATDTKQELLY